MNAHRIRQIQSQPSQRRSMPNPPLPVRVVYLFGAGASHACAQAVGSAYGILMRHLSEDLAEHVHKMVQDRARADESLRTLVNDVINAQTDIEHVITFLDESSSALHRAFATELRRAFEEVLRRRLDAIALEQGRIPNDLYSVLLDMYTVAGLPEVLRGFLTLNYDSYLETAINSSRTQRCDTGIFLPNSDVDRIPVKTLKLHGSFDWNETWPVTPGHGENTLWIPPGIQKAKGRYPFNLIWGLARELLDCDVLRIVGCRLGPNDWDLISLLFATRHTNASMHPYRVEVIDAPKHAFELQRQYPYLDVQSILEVEPVGSQLIGELRNGAPANFQSLSTAERKELLDQTESDKNWFRLWLKLKAEVTRRDLASISTASGAFARFLEED